MADIQMYDPEQSNYRFNPSEHLMQIKSSKGNSDYLEVKYRLVWFRSLCPNGAIRTEMVHLDMDRKTEEEAYAWNSETRRSEKIIKRAPGIAIFRAIVEDGKGGHAEATKCEKAASFGDYIEKAETGAVGRALAMLGYGTQFVGEEFDEGHRIVDAPATQNRQTTHQQRKAPSETEQQAYRERRKVVDADQPNERHPILAEIFKAGIQTKAWTAENFYASASAILSAPVSKSTQLTPEQAKCLMQAAERGPVEVTV